MIAGAAIVIVASVPLMGSAGAATPNTAGKWEMNEAAGTGVLVDSSGNRLNGTIGSSVQAGTVYGGATGHRFTTVDPNTSPVNPHRLDTVPHDYRLDPESYDLAVTVRLRTTQPAGNVVQKSQSMDPGGFYKVDMDGGRVFCTFKGSAGAVAAKSPASISDGAWHTIRCERAGASVVLTIDGILVDRRSGSTGVIANSSVVSIAGKTSCNQVTVGCDYFSGDIDRVSITTSRPVVK